MNKQTYYSLNPWWENRDFETGIFRPLYLNHFLKRLKRRQIEIIIGSRRVGKTTLLKQIIKKLLEQKIKREKILYVSCDFAKAIGIPISAHLNFFRQLFTHSKGEKLYLFLDEVQESPDWQIELKSLYDNDNLKIFCSGSTSALIKTHGEKLTGRQINTVVYPLNFKEFLNFKQVKLNYSEGYLLEKKAEEYLQIGGYPENVLVPSEEYLASLLEDIFLRDLVRLYPVKNLRAIKNLLKLVAASVSSRVSFNKLSNVLGISLDTAKDYLVHLEDAFLVKKLNKWSPSYSEKTYALKKIYLVDNGFKTLLTGRGDWGAKAENAVFWQLNKIHGDNLGYFAESQKEVDFIAGSFSKPQLFEIKYTDSLDKLKSGLSGLRLFLKRYPKVKKAQVITKSLDKKVQFTKAQLELIPLWRFLLEA